MKFENKFVSRTVAILFALMLALLCAVTLFHKVDEFSYYENRNLRSFPQRTGESVLSGEYFTDIESCLADHAAGRQTLVKLNAAMELKLLRKPVVNETVITDEVLLPYLDYEPSAHMESIAEAAELEAQNIAAHRDVIQSYGGRFCYVAVPCQYVCLEDSYPWYLENRSEYTDATSAAFFAALQSRGVEYIDMRAVYDEMDTEDRINFTSTKDNHFSIFGAYRTYREMTDKIALDWGGELDVLGDGDYRAEKIPNRYLGSRNRKLFNLWSNDEALYCIYPKADVPFVRYNGDVEVVPIVYSLPEDPYSFAMYPVYMGGDVPRSTIDTARPELPSVLIYGDSFTNALECIAWYSFDKMYSIDLRYYTETTLDEFIAEAKPDYVFCIRDYEALLSTDGNGQ